MATASHGQRDTSITARELAALAAIKLLLSFAILAAGFHGISDDDFSRTATAQEFSVRPSFDPSRSSWLPLPFWINGAVMAVFEPSWSVARGLAIALGVASVWLIRVAAGWLTNDRRAAFAGAVLVAGLTWTTRLGVCPVPELPTTALCLVALAGLSKDTTPARRLAAAAALFAASLCRYEPWFLMVGFCLFTTLDALRDRRDRINRLGACVLAGAAPVLWIAWNWHLYGDPLAFLHTVASYKEAIDHGSTWDRATAYAAAALRAEPELLFIAGYLAVRARDRRVVLQPFARPAIVVGIMFVALTLSNLKGGAPTHHNERAVLAIPFLIAAAAGALLVSSWRANTLGRPFVIAAYLAAAIPASIALRAFVFYRESYAHREIEIAVGEDVRRLVPPEEKVVVEVIDYGYFAIEAGSGRPWVFIPSREVSLHGPMELRPFDWLADRAALEGTRWIVATRRGDVPGVENVSCRGEWCLYRLD